MKRPMTATVATIVTLVIATAAAAVPVETSADLNLRAGPGTRYPVVATMPRGAIVDLADCDGSWCVVGYRGVRGWASGRYLVRLPFRPAPQGGFLSRLFQREAPPPLPSPPVGPGAGPVAPPPAPVEPRREPASRSGRPVESRPGTSANPPAQRPGGGTAPGILSAPMPSVRVPLPDATPSPAPDATGDDGPTSARPGPPAPPATSSPREPPAGDATTSEGAEAPARRPRRGGAPGADVL